MCVGGGVAGMVGPLQTVVVVPFREDDGWKRRRRRLHHQGQ